MKPNSFVRLFKVRPVPLSITTIGGLLYLIALSPIGIGLIFVLPYLMIPLLAPLSLLPSEPPHNPGYLAKLLFVVSMLYGVTTILTNLMSPTKETTSPAEKVSSCMSFLACLLFPGTLLYFTIVQNSFSTEIHPQQFYSSQIPDGWKKQFSPIRTWHALNFDPPENSAWVLEVSIGDPEFPTVLKIYDFPIKPGWDYNNFFLSTLPLDLENQRDYPKLKTKLVEGTPKLAFIINRNAMYYKEEIHYNSYMRERFWLQEPIKRRIYLIELRGGMSELDKLKQLLSTINFK